MMKSISCILSLLWLVFSFLSCNKQSNGEGYIAFIPSSGPVKFSLRIYDKNNNDLLANGSIKSEDIKITYPNYKATDVFTIDRDTISNYIYFLLEQPNERKINNDIDKQTIETLSYIDIKGKVAIIKAEIEINIGSVKNVLGNSSVFIKKVWYADKLIYEKRDEAVEPAIGIVILD